VLFENEGERTKVSPVFQSKLASTLITLSPLNAVLVRTVETVVGAIPFKLRDPVITKYLLPATMGSI